MKKPSNISKKRQNIFKNFEENRQKYRKTVKIIDKPVKSPQKFRISSKKPQRMSKNREKRQNCRKTIKKFKKKKKEKQIKISKNRQKFQ